MAIQSFKRAFDSDNAPCIVKIQDKEYKGFFANIRVDRQTVPEGWHAYDLRDGDSDGEACELKNGYVVVNHLGTFCTKEKLPLAEGESLYRGCDSFDIWFC